ncbi:MAG TPA: TetR/AcrR family transcriptional regulator [Bacillota bacterium]
MPKETFFNLSEEKKQRIFDAAVQEFATRRFSEASLNQIVKAAQIPWGSFYQYFSGKEDLYLYMLDRISGEKREIARHSETLDREADFFEICIQTIKATFEWSRHNPQYIQIAILMEIDNSEFIAKIRSSLSESFGKLVERDKERGLIKPDVDSDLVGDMIYTLIWKQFYLAGSDEELFYKRLTEGINIIKEGIAKS